MSGERVIRALPPDSLLGRELVIPTVVLFDGSENLRILSASSVAVTLAIYVRMRRTDGSIDPMQFSHTPNTDRTVKTTDHVIGAGVLLNLIIVPISGSPLVGETFVQASIIRGLSGATLPQGVLAQDYTTTRQPVAWPGGQLRRSTEGQGAPRSVVSRSQTGAANSVTVPTGARWKLTTVNLGLDTTPSAGFNRQLIFAVIDGAASTTRYSVVSTVMQPNGVFWSYFLIPGVQPQDMSASSIIVLSAFPELVVRGGDVLFLNAANLDGIDTLWMRINAEEWLEVA